MNTENILITLMLFVAFFTGYGLGLIVEPRK